MLQKENIFLNLCSDSKETILKDLGNSLLATGYVTNDYVKSIIKREQEMSTYLSNGVAVPHGLTSESAEGILKNGIAIATIPDGIDWGNGQIVRVIIMIAAERRAHMNVLAKAAKLCSDESKVKAILTMTVDEIYDKCRFD